MYLVTVHEFGMMNVWGSEGCSDEFVHGTAINTLRTGDADLRFYITTVQDGW